MEGTNLLKRLERFKYPLLALLLGLAFMLLPARGAEERREEGEGTVLELVLSRTEGVGRIRVIVSEKGAVIVCDGAESAAVRLDILHAVTSYTGLGSDKITVLKMSDGEVKGGI